MNRTWMLVLLMFGWSAALCAAAEEPPLKVDPRTGFRQDFGTLTERNMFVRDRSRPTTRRVDPPPRVVERPPEQFYILTGVVQEGDVLRAYFEDTSRGSMLKLTVGDSIARGRISRISLEGIEYQSAAGDTSVEVGRNLQGSAITRPASSAFASPSTSSPGSAAAGSGSSSSGEAPGGASASPDAAAGTATGGSPGAATGSGDVAGLDPNDPNLTPEQRMRLRRAQLLNQR